MPSLPLTRVIVRQSVGLMFDLSLAREHHQMSAPCTRLIMELLSSTAMLSSWEPQQSAGHNAQLSMESIYLSVRNLHVIVKSLGCLRTGIG